MPTPPLDDRIAKADIAAVETALRAGYPPNGKTGRGKETAVTVAARSRRIARTTMQSRLQIIKRTHNVEPDWSLWTPPDLAADAVLPAEHPRDRQVRRHLDQINSLTKQLRDMQRQANADDDLRRAVFGLADQTLTPPDWLDAKPSKTSGITGVPILFTSDFQFGETVRADEMSGINEYNPTVAERRYKLLIDKTIELSFRHMVKPNYPGMVYIRGGDAVSGEIHDELQRTNTLEAIPAVNRLVEIEAAGLERCAKEFGAVHVISVPGNHGRAHRKPYSKRYVATNYDTLSAWMLEKWFRKDGRLTFHTPGSGDAEISIYGWNFLLTHGDRIGSRGGGGFIGPAATITRGMKKIVDYYATLGKIVDHVLVGHFHTSLELEHGWANGSLPGMTEYGRDGRFRPAPPKQWLLFVHPDYGVTARWPILLERPVRTPVAGPPIKVTAA